MACSRVVPRSTPPSTIKFGPGNTSVISGQGEPTTTRGSEARMLRHPGADAPGKPQHLPCRIGPARIGVGAGGAAAGPGVAGCSDAPSLL